MRYFVYYEMKIKTCASLSFTLTFSLRHPDLHRAYSILAIYFLNFLFVFKGLETQFHKKTIKNNILKVKSNSYNYKNILYI